MILVTGSTGLLGSAIVLYLRHLGRPVLAATHRASWASSVPSLALDLNAPGKVRSALHERGVTAIVHCAALTNVDYCQTHPEETERVIVDSTRVLAEEASAAKIALLYVSTDSVFDGTQIGYRESDPIRPLNLYARAKADAEQAALEALPQSIVLRTNLFGWSATTNRGLAGWAVEQLTARRPISGFTDCVFNPMFTFALAEWIVAALDARISGLWHLGTANYLSKFDFLRMLAEELGYDPALVAAATMDSMQFAAPRPRNTALNASALAAVLARPLPEAREQIARFAHFSRSGLLNELRSLVKEADYARH